MSLATDGCGEKVLPSLGAPQFGKNYIIVLCICVNVTNIYKTPGYNSLYIT